MHEQIDGGGYGGRRLDALIPQRRAPIVGAIAVITIDAQSFWMATSV
jgi:hypothetical protein